MPPSRIDELIRAFDRAAEDLERWEQLAPRTFANLTRKFVHAPWLFPLSQCAKFRPIRVRGRTVWGAGMRAYLPDYFHLARHGVLGDPMEIGLAKYLSRHVGRKDVFFDVGASCGFYSLLADYLIGGDARSIHAFEPTPSVFTLLAENTRLSRAIVANECAVAETPGAATLYMNARFPVSNTLEGNRASTMYRAGASHLDRRVLRAERRPANAAED